MTPKVSRFLLLLLLFLLAACSQPGGIATAVSAPTAAPAINSQTAVSLPPTFTPVPANTPRPAADTLAPSATQTAVSPTPIAFDQTVVELRVVIPAIWLDRRLEGKLGGTMIVADEASGVILQRTNEGNVVAELRQLLPTLTLAPLPEGCDSCVALSYNLPADDRSGAGWLQDIQLLASVENYLSGVLGPHFPADTVAGLHRAPSPYAPAQTVALAANGRLWHWLATDAQIPAPDNASLALLSTVESLQGVVLASAYEVACVGGVAGETLWLQPSSEAAAQQVRLLCPEFALPNTLQPLYLALDSVLAPRLAALAGPQRPPARFPLAALLDYRRADGARLTLLADGGVVAETAVDSITSTLPISQTAALVGSLLASGELSLGLTSFDETAAPHHQLLVRGPEGVVDGSWGAETAVLFLADLDSLLQQLLPASAAPTATSTPDPVLTATATPTP